MERLTVGVFGDKDVDDAWAVEIERRVEEIESGRAGQQHHTEASQSLNSAASVPYREP